MNSTNLGHPTFVKKVFKQTVALIKNNWSVDHVMNAQGVPVLAIRIRDGKAWLMDRNGKDVTKQFAQHL